jgi:L-lactate dehydrogenase complex protein LldG
MNETIHAGDSTARERILERLRRNRPVATPEPTVYQKPLGWDRDKRVDSFIERMQAVRGEVHRLPSGDWVEWIRTELPRRGLSRLLLGQGDIGDAVAAISGDATGIRRYDRPIEDWKDALFHDVDVAVTGARAGLAESGSLVLIPDTNEPRLMSLVPPVHVAVLKTDRLYENFAEMMEAEAWANGMPTNALLISGPSKTADIEQTLAYGIHGPKQLITLLID